METQELNFLESIYKLLEDECVITNTEARPVIKYEDPEVLKTKIDFELNEPVASPNDLLELCRTVIQYSVKTRHPNFRNQLYGGVDLYGLGATWISEALNTNQHTFEVAPAFTLCESFMLQHVMKLFGYAQGDGIFSPGGSMSNMYAMVMARYLKYPQIKSEGLRNIPTLVCFTSDQAHYSIQKGMHWLGFGIDHLVKVQSDDLGRMIPQQLEVAIQQCLDNGNVPLFVNATVGTTVLGAIDPLPEIARICQKYNVWMHVDACYGGTLILSKVYRQKLDGIEMSDSISWNPHKMLGAPLTCSIVITKHKNLMHECNSAAASYLFQQDKHYDVRYDTGDKSIQCGRKVDAFKLWVMWKARGDDGLSVYVDSALQSVSYFFNKVKSTAGFRLVIPTIETTSVSFWYIPKKMRSQVEDDEWHRNLYKVAPKIKEKMVREGTLMIGYTPVKHFGNFFRFVVTCHPQTTSTHMDQIIAKIIEYGEQV